MSRPTVVAKAPMGVREWLMLGVLSLVWGASFFAIEISITAFEPLTVVAIRVSLAALGLYCFMRFTGVPLPHKNASLLHGSGQAGPRFGFLHIWAALALMGLVNNIIPFSLIVWGQTQITSSLASILNATMPLFTVFLAHFFVADERLTPARFLGVVIGFAGVVLIIGPEGLSGIGAGIAGKIAVLGASLSYAVAVVVGRRFVVMGMKPVQMAFGQVMMAAIMLVPVALILDKPYLLPMPSWQVLAALASLALVSTSFAYLLYFRLIAEAGATNASLVTLTIPVVATGLGILFLGEVFDPSHAMGLGLIALGLLVIDGRILARRRVSTAR